MKKLTLLFTFLLCALFTIAIYSQNAPTVYTIGDSTMADYDVNTSQLRGWGQMLKQFLTGDAGNVNAARNGRSSKTFYNEGLWTNVVNKLKAGDYVFIQFGHNDEKSDGVSGDVGTDPWGEYREYLAKYVNETRAKNAIPVLLTPVVRCYFSGNTITEKGAHNLSMTEDSLLNYPRAMKAVARDLNVLLVDHTTLTKELAESYGVTDAKAIIYGESDNTHLSETGATLYARLVVNDLIRQGVLTSYLNSSPDIILNPVDIDFGSCYVSTSADKKFTISGSGLNPLDGTVNVEASEGFMVSTSATDGFANSINLNYSNGSLTASTIFIRFQPAEARSYSGTITVSGDFGEPKTISLTGNALALSGGAEAIIHYPLTDNAEAEITGPVTSLGESWSGVYMKNYANPSSTVYWPDGVAGGKAQRNIIEGDEWPGGEIDIVTTRYIQFALQPAANTNFVVDSIGVYAGAAGGNGMGYRVMISTQADFGDFTVLEDKPSNVSNTMLALSYRPIYQVKDGETFYLRFYPWYSSKATSKYLCFQNLVIKGTVTQDDQSGICGDMLNSQISIGPNPSNGIFNVSGIERDAYVEIYNQTGTLQFKTKLSQNGYVIDLTLFPSGVYVCNIISEKGKVVKKLIKN